MTGLAAAGAAWWRLGRRGWTAIAAVAVVSGASVFLWRMSANMPQLNGDGIPGVSAIDLAAPAVTYLSLSIYADLRYKSSPQAFRQVRVLAALACLSQVGDLARDATAVIFQDFVQYMLEAWQNIGLGRPECIHDWPTIINASTLSGADEFINELPNGLNTLLGPIFEGGTELSTGQWQGIALARAFFRDASFRILDEPTASLDARAEHELFQNIRELAAGRSVLLSSHRFSSVRSADRIYVLRHGQVVEEGTHDQLIQPNGLYAQLLHLQASSYTTIEGDR